MIAALYDIHGNLPALEAVLGDLPEAPEHWLLGGDYAGLGAWPVETLTRLRELEPATWLRGNWERWLAQPEDAVADPLVTHAIEWCAERLGRETVQNLGSLAEQAVVAGARCCHASPRSDMESFAPTATEHDADLLAGVGERRLIFGHTHVQFERRAGDVTLINPGSVGLPFDGDPRAAYAILHDDGRLTLRRVAYDQRASARAVRERMGQWAQPLVARIERAGLDA